MGKKITIIVPVYNAEKSIEETLMSLYLQEYSDYEVVIVDDGSTDNSSRICKRYIEDKPLFSYLYQENAGVSSARNLGLKVATGDYIIFVDADDTLPYNCLENYSKYITENDKVLVCGSHIMKKTRKRIICNILECKNFTIQSTNEIKELLEKIPTAPWGKLYNKKILNEYDIEFPCGMPYGEDAIFLYNYLEHIDFIMTFNDIVYEYSFTDTNYAGRKFYKKFYYYVKTVYDAKKHLLKKLGIDDYNDEINLFRQCLEHYIVNENNKKDCVIDVINCIDAFPDSVRDPEYGRLVYKKNVYSLIRKWKRKNLYYYFCERIKNKLKI